MRYEASTPPRPIGQQPARGRATIRALVWRADADPFGPPHRAHGEAVQ